MPVGGEDIYRDGPNLSPHLRFFTALCIAKGANPRKAERWAQVQVVKKGRRSPPRGPTAFYRCATTGLKNG